MRAVFSRLGLRKSAILLFSLLGIVVYAACDPNAPTAPYNDEGTRSFSVGSNSVSLPASVSSGYLNATITSQRSWTDSGYGSLQWATGGLQSNQNSFSHYRSQMYNGQPVDYGYDVLAYCEILDGSGTILKRNAKGQGMPNILGEMGLSSSYPRSGQPNDIAPDNNTFCDFDVRDLDDGSYILRFGKGRARATRFYDANGQWVTDRVLDRQEGSAYTSTFYVDNSPPTGGALTVNGSAAASSTDNASSQNTSGSFTISRTDFSDTSGMASNTLTRSKSNFAANYIPGDAPLRACAAYYSGGSFLQEVTISPGTTTQSGLSPGCYRYTLRGVDNVGRASSISTWVVLDSTLPTGGQLTTPEWASSSFDIATPSQFFSDPDGPGVNDLASTNGVISSVVRRQNSGPSLPYDGAKSVVYGANRFVGVGLNDSSFTSTDGLSWSKTIAPKGNWSSVAFGNGIFVAVGDPYISTNSPGSTPTNPPEAGSNTVMTSTDGINWTARTSPLGSWRSIAYGTVGGNPLFVAVARWSGAVMTSTNGITWTSRTAPSGDWLDVVYDQSYNRFVAVAFDKKIMTSTNGIDWSYARSVPTSSSGWTGVAQGYAVLVAIGSSGTIFSNDGGSTWQTQDNVNRGSSIIYTGGYFITDSNHISTDGQYWRELPVWPGASIKAYGKGLYVGARNPLSSTDYFAASFLNGNNLWREKGDLLSGTCSNWGGRTLTGRAQSGLVDGCYRYTLSAINYAGGEGSVSSITKIDSTPPTGGAVNPPATSSSGIYTVAVTNFSDTQSGMKSNVLQRRSTTSLSNNSCPTDSSTSWSSWSSTAASQSGLETGCYQYRVQGTNNADASAISSSATTKVDTTPPSGGSVSSPSWSSSGTFTVTVTNFADSHSSMASNNLQRRGGTLGSGGCSGYSDNWSATTSSQSNLSEGCYQYRLLGSNGVGGDATSAVSETRVDKTSPAVSIVLDDPTSSPTKANSWSYTLTFRNGPGGYLENVTGLSGSTSSALTNDIPSSSGGASGCAFALSGTGWERKVTVSACSEGDFRLRLSAAAVQDQAGNGNLLSLSGNLSIDRTAPAPPPCLDLGSGCLGPDDPPGEGSPSATNGISGCTGEAGDSSWFRSNLTCYIYVTETFTGSPPQAPRLEVQENWGGSSLQAVQNRATQLVTGPAATGLNANQRLYLAQFTISTQRSDIYLRIRIIDQANNESLEINTYSGPFSRGVIKIDKLAPENPAINSGTSQNCNNQLTNWQDGDWFKEVKCAFDDPLDTPSPDGGRPQASGIDRFQYKVCPYGLSEAACGDKSWSAVDRESNIFSPPDDGAYKILLRTQDRAGWPSASVTRFAKVDSTAPVNTAPFADVVYPDEDGYPLVRVDARDLRKGTSLAEGEIGGYFSSGLASLECYLVEASNPVAGREISNSSSNSCQETIRDDDLALRWVARDLAKSANGQAGGNVRQGIINPRIDMNRPTLEVTSAPSGWEKQVAEITLVASDTGGNNSGVQSIDLLEDDTYYRGLGKRSGTAAAPATEVCGPLPDGGMQCSYRFTSEGDRRYKFVARDGSKRASTPVSVWVRIDRTRPSNPGAISYDPDNNRWNGQLKVSGAAAQDLAVAIDSQSQEGSGQVRGRLELCLDRDIRTGDSSCSNPISVNHSSYSSYLPARGSSGIPCSPTIEAEDSKYTCWVDGNRLNYDAQQAPTPVSLDIEPLRARFLARDAAGNESAGAWTSPVQASGRMCSLTSSLG